MSTTPQGWLLKLFYSYSRNQFFNDRKWLKIFSSAVGFGPDAYSRISQPAGPCHRFYMAYMGTNGESDVSVL